MSAAKAVQLDNQKHLTNEQKEKLEELIIKFEGLFGGKVGTHDGIRISFQLKPDAVPHYVCLYNIPIALMEVTKNTIKMMFNEGVLERSNANIKWAAPTFAVAKKTAGVHIISNFRALNQWIK